MGFLKNLLGGGNKAKGYQSDNVGQYEKDAYGAIKNSEINPLTGYGGVKKATTGFDFNPINQAQAGFQYGAGIFTPQGGGGGGSGAGGPGSLFDNSGGFFKKKAGLGPTPGSPVGSFGYTPTNAFKTTYSPTQYNFAQLPQQYADTAYQQGAKNVRRESAGNLEQLKEAIGTRRPGLFAGAAANAQRNEGENLANLSAQTNLERLRQNVELGKQQQLEQAGENLRGAQFNLGTEQANAAERFKNLEALGGLGQNKIQTESNLLQNERGYNQQDIQNLLNLFQSAGSLTNQGASLAAQNKSSTLGSLLGLAKIAAPFIPGIGPGVSAGLAGAGALASN